MARSIQRSRFVGLLRRHLDAGTRASSNRSAGRIWRRSEFAAEIGVSAGAVGRWINGESLPSLNNYMRIERAFFGDNETREKNQLRSAYDNERSPESEFFNWTLAPMRDEENVSQIGNHQLYLISTPITRFSISDLRLLSLSIIISSGHNILRPMQDLVDTKLTELDFVAAADVNDFMDHVSYNLGVEDPLSLISNILDEQFAVIYKGSIEPVTSQLLARLPLLIKGFATLSNRQFRVGLFRLAATIVVIAITGSAVSYLTMRALHEIGRQVVHTLSSP